MTFITLDEAKEHLAIDPGLTIHDARIQRYIGAAIDWAENFCQRPLGQLLQLSSPSDGAASPMPDPLDSPHFVSPPPNLGVLGVEGYDDQWSYWSAASWTAFYKNNPLYSKQVITQRRDIKEAILLRVELMFDRNTDNWELLDKTSTDMLFPYRLGMGV